MDSLENHKTIHQLKSDQSGFGASLLIDETSREYVLQVNVFDQKRTATNKEDALLYLTELFNYYQCLITPPIVAAPQVMFVDENSDLKPKRSMPGMGKINGRTRLKIVANGQAGIVGQLFRQLYCNETYGLPSHPAENDLGKVVGKLFKL